MPEWFSESLRLIPAAGLVIAFVWGYFRLFLDDKIRSALNGKIDKSKEELLATINGQGARIKTVEGNVSYLQGRIDGHDAALARHTKGNQDTAPLGYVEHARDLVSDLERLLKERE